MTARIFLNGEWLAAGDAVAVRVVGVLCAAHCVEHGGLDGRQ